MREIAVAKDRFEQRLDDAARVWRRQRYTGPVPAFEPRRGFPRLAWAGALAAALFAVVLLRPGQPDWPEELRPVLRGSPLAAETPRPPAARVVFRLPDAPGRQTCFSQTENCDQPTG